MQLSPIESRIIGCLLEKEITTPEHYPLSLNALTQACNQKTSREPVMALTETEVQQGIDSLNKKRAISEQTGFGSRVIKYKHRFCNTEFSDLQLSAAQVAVLCLLLLRGPQTSGELRTRSSRLYSFSDITQVDQTLDTLRNLTQPLVHQLPKTPGKREIRFQELITEYEKDSVLSLTSPSALNPGTHEELGSEIPLQERVATLEHQVAELTYLLEELMKTTQT